MKSMARRTTLLQAACLSLFTCIAGAAESAFPNVRTPAGQRRFTSPAVEQAIQNIQSSIGNKELAWLFGNCFPNTLGTILEIYKRNPALLN
jgi:hypothetical protein